MLKMGIYQSGTAVTISETFTVLGVPTNPTTVTYTVVAPDGTQTAYVFGVDAEVTNPSAGVFVLDLPVLTDPGVYVYQIAGTGAVEATSPPGEFTVLQSATAPQDVPWPQPGPCVPWIDCDDITSACTVPADDVPLLGGIAEMASQLMWMVSGRQFSGNCERTVRPCETLGTCWESSPYFGWSGWPWAWAWDGITWGWYDQAGCHCGCKPMSRVLLPGYPVTEIVEVKIDGVAQATSTYRLDEWQYLTRMRNPLEPDIPLFWPACQVMDLDDTEPGTWSVTYKSGINPPLAGKAAAAALACELLPGTECKLPSNARRIVRQGITIDRIEPLADMLLKGQTGIVAIDAFIAAYNPNGLRRRPAIWSPDGPKYARPVGS